MIYKDKHTLRAKTNHQLKLDDSNKNMYSDSSFSRKSRRQENRQLIKFTNKVYSVISTLGKNKDWWDSVEHSSRIKLCREWSSMNMSQFYRIQRITKTDLNIFSEWLSDNIKKVEINKSEYREKIISNLLN